MLTAPLIRRPGVYLADVSAGPTGYQRLVVDARNGQILERFPLSGRMWRSALIARGDEFGEPASPGIGRPPLSGEVPGPSASARAPKPSSGGSAVHIPAAISPYGPGAAPANTTSKTKVASIERKIPGTKALLINPPLPPPAPREATKAEEPGTPAFKPAANADSGEPPVASHPAEADNVSPAAGAVTQGSSPEANDKAKVSIVPPAPFE